MLFIVTFDFSLVAATDKLNLIFLDIAIPEIRHSYSPHNCVPAIETNMLSITDHENEIIYLVTYIPKYTRTRMRKFLKGYLS